MKRGVDICRDCLIIPIYHEYGLLGTVLICEYIALSCVRQFGIYVATLSAERKAYTPFVLL